MRATSHDGGSSTSYWMDPAFAPDEPAPDPRAVRDEPAIAAETDVCIVGAGIAGLSTALSLVRAGTNVIVLDDGPIGGGETGRTSAHLASAVDDRFHVLESKFGARGAELVAESHAAAIDEIEENVRELGIACDFQRVDGYLFAPPGEQADRELDKEYAAAQRAGLLVDRIARAPLPFDTGPALRFCRQAEFHPLAYLRGIAAAIVERGGAIHTNTHVEDITAGEPLKVKLSSGREVRCRVAVDATNGAFTSPKRLPLRQAAYRTYVLGFDIKAGAIPHGLYWDTPDPYHYIRIARGPAGREVLIVGGNDHRTGQGDPERAWRELESWTRQWIPSAGAIVTRWSGQVIEPVDGPAHIGKSPELDHVYVVTGDSGNGLTHGVIAGLLLPELMRGHRPPWADIYDPSRSHLHALGSFLREATHSSVPYTDWLRGGDVPTLEAIEPGDGAVLRRGLHLVACFRDEAGVLHEMSATCPHLRGVVHWNAVEKTWDCPCHGSRFDPRGRVLNGPASRGLAKIGDTAEPTGTPIPVPAAASGSLGTGATRGRLK